VLDKRSRLAGATLAIGVAFIAVGCNPVPTPTASPTPPNPVTILARWSEAQLGLSFGPHDANNLAIGPDGSLYVTDLSQRVTVISPAGHVLFRWGRQGTGPGEFRFLSQDPNDPRDISGKVAVDSHGFVYVSDSGNARIQVFTREGHFVRQFGSFGDGSGQFRFPFDLAVDGAGDVYVIDGGRIGVLMKFSPVGKLVWQVGDATSPDPDLGLTPHLTTIDRHGRLVMVSGTTGVVFYLDQNGRKVDAFGLGETGETAWCDVNVDALGDTFLTGCGPPRFQFAAVFDHTHRLIKEWKGGGEELAIAPRFGPNGEVFALGWDGSLLKLKITLPEG
jgi:NHL repeat